MERRDFLKNTLAAGAVMGFASAWGTESFFQQTKQPDFKQPFRQIHLDFHTHGGIQGIADHFDAEEFASTLFNARVNSVNCFAKCHHGWLYYQSKKFPELVHPNLTKDLLRLQTEALHKRNMNVIAYLSVQLDYENARKHPEWRALNPDGTMQGGEIGSPHFGKPLCLNTPYNDLIKEQIREVAESLPVDGFWLDIISTRDCSCNWCRERMLQQGLNPANKDDRMKNGVEVTQNYILETSAFIRNINPGFLIFYNSGHTTPFHRKVDSAFSHFELESLSSSSKWGYPFFQNEARYVRTLGKEMVGMTGKFHSIWGDFHSFKNRYALEFDCFQSLALTGKCSVGDQLHPNGRIDPFTYELIGTVYNQVEEKEPWCEGAEPLVEIGIFTEEEYQSGIKNYHPDGLWGASHMLLESGFQYDVIDSEADFSKYKLLILPDTIPVEGAFKTKLQNYILAGGKVILSFESGMDNKKAEFADFCGVVKYGDGPLDAEGKPVAGKVFEANNYAQYLIPQGAIGEGLNKTEYVMYIRGIDIQEKDGSEVLLYNTLSYFDRKNGNFCSHLQTPSSGKTGLPSIVQNKNVIYFSHPVFRQYNLNAAPWCKTLVVNAIDILMPERLVRTNGPSSLVTCLNKQSHQNRKILHLLHYIPQQRSLQFQTIDEAIPLNDIEIKITCGNRVNSVMKVPENEKIKFKQTGSELIFKLDRLKGHQMIEIKERFD
jgi:hypothetical protein